MPTFAEFWDIFPHKSDQVAGWRASWHLEQIPRPIDKIVYQERLNADLTSIPAFRNCRLTYEHVDTAPNKQPWHTYYTPELVARVIDHWGQDFETFGYTMDFNACIRGEFWTSSSI